LRILIYGINFFPEVTGIAKYSTEMVAWLRSKGHDIRVITAYPYYPHWKIQDGYKCWMWTTDVLEGCKIYRCPLWVPAKVTGLSRLIHLASFALSSFPVLLMQIFWRPRIVITIAPPLFIAPATIFFKIISKCKTILHIQDFEIDAAFQTEILRGGHWARFAFWVEGYILRNFDLVSSISGKMLEKAAFKKVDINKLFLLPNWVDMSRYSLFNDENARKEYRGALMIPENAIIALYSGNMGKKQGLGVLVEVAKMVEASLHSEAQVIFLFCGNGVERQSLQNKCSGLSNVIFLDLQPEEMLPKFLCMVDIHLLPQLASVADLVMPSKLTGILASGRPVIACANADTELAHVVNSCGIVVAPEDLRSLYEGLMYLIKNPSARKGLGTAGRDYAIKNLNHNLILEKFESKLRSIN